MINASQLSTERLPISKSTYNARIIPLHYFSFYENFMQQLRIPMNDAVLWKCSVNISSKQNISTPTWVQQINCSSRSRGDNASYEQPASSI